MDHLLLIPLLFSELCGVSSRTPQRYHFVNQNKTWANAQVYCKNNFTNLATVTNTDNINTMIKSVKDGYNHMVWIGLKKTENYTWRWSLPLQDNRVYSLEETNFTSWASGEPNHQASDEDCVILEQGAWTDEPCSKNYKFICYNGGHGQNERYILINNSMIWRKAQNYCRKNHTDLASVWNQSENQIIIQTAGVERVWIGLYRDKWKWSDQTNSLFRFWSPGIPDNSPESDCAVTKLHENGEWGDRPCVEEYPFFCHEICPYKLDLIHENKTWREAVDYCERQDKELVSASSEEMWGWVREVARGASTPHVWMGLHFLCSMKFWFWISGVTVCGDDWAAGNGTGRDECGRAGALQSGGEMKWVSLPENERLNFICRAL